MQNLESNVLEQGKSPRHSKSELGQRGKERGEREDFEEENIMINNQTHFKPKVCEAYWTRGAALFVACFLSYCIAGFALCFKILDDIGPVLRRLPWCHTYLFLYFTGSLQRARSVPQQRILWVVVFTMLSQALTTSFSVIWLFGHALECKVQLWCICISLASSSTVSSWMMYVNDMLSVIFIMRDLCPDLMFNIPGIRIEIITHIMYSIPWT